VASAPAVSAWVLTFDLAPIQRLQLASCYVGGVLPAPPPTPTVTTLRMQTVLFEGATSTMLFETFIAPQTLRIGESPVYVWPPAISGGARAGSTTTFTSTEQVRRLGPSPRTAIELRQFATTFSFVRNGAQATGTITVSSQYSCVDNGAMPAAQCPRTAPFAMDAASCSVTMPFTAQQQAQVPLWPRPSAPQVGVPQYGAFITVDFVTDPSCYRDRQVPVQQWSETNQPRYRPLQPTTLPSGPALTLAQPLNVRLGDSPDLLLSDPLLATGTNVFAWSSTLTQTGPFLLGRTANETRSWAVTFPFAPMNGVHQGPMTVRSEYSCVDSGAQPAQRCPLGTATDPLGPDAATCQRALPVEAFLLP